MILMTIILILVFVMMMNYAVSYQNFKIFGLSFAPEHAETDEVKTLQRQFRVTQLIIGAVFIGLSFLVSLDLFQGLRDFMWILILFSYFVLSYVPVSIWQRKFMVLKQEKGWIYETQKRVVDISVTREKGKAAPSKKWAWLIWLLSWVPVIMAWVAQSSGSFLLPLILVPLTLIVIPLSYDMVISSKTPFVSKDSEVTQAYMRHFERNNAVSYLEMSLMVNIFFIAFTALILFNPSDLWLILLLGVFLLAIVALMARTTQKNKDLQATFFDQAEWQMPEEEGQYKWGAYYNPNDSRLFVPKRISGMGTTINVAHPAGKVIMAILGILVVGIIGLVLMMSLSEYDVSIQADTVAVEAPMYGLEVAYDQIESIELNEGPLEGSRTNGFGGMEKRFGHFNLEGYGPVELFIYDSHPYHIDIQFNDGESPGWLIFNQTTQAETEAVYQALVEQWEMNQ
ncbi:MAG: DUF5808 domain-containing protein [Ruoffia tabacinasalis]